MSLTAKDNSGIRGDYGRATEYVDYIYNGCREMGFDPWAFSDVISDVMRRAPDTAWLTLAHRLRLKDTSERVRNIVLDLLAARSRKGSL